MDYTYTYVRTRYGTLLHVVHMYTNTGTFLLYMYILIHAYMYATESKVLGLDQIGVFQTTESSLYRRIAALEQQKYRLSTVATARAGAKICCMAWLSHFVAVSTASSVGYNSRVEDFNLPGSDGDNFYRQTFFGIGRHDPLFFYRCLRPSNIRDEGDKPHGGGASPRELRDFFATTTTGWW